MKKGMKKRITAAALSGIMVMSMGMTAFAEETEHEPVFPPNSSVLDTTFTMVKNVTTDGKTFAPDTTFTFNLTEGIAETIKDFGDSNKDVIVFAGEPGGLYFKDILGNKVEDGTSVDIVYTAEDGTDINHPESVYSKTQNIGIDVSAFTKPGIYHYVLQESDGNYEGIIYDTIERDLYVYVEAVDAENLNFGYQVVGMLVKKDGESGAYGDSETEGKVGLEFTNNYGKEDEPENPDKPDPNDTTHDLILTKEVTGNQGDKSSSNKFKFTIKVTAQDNKQERYYVEYGKMVDGEFVANEGENQTLVLTSGVLNENILLAHGESIRIYGLTENDKYEINEVDNEGNLAGYTTNVVASNWEKNEAIDERENHGTVNEDGTALTYFNDKSVTTPTGIVMTFAPYALILGLAGAFAAIFLGKKKHEDEI